MTSESKKYLLSYLFAALFALCCFSLQIMAAKQTDAIVFTSFEELRDYCTQTTESKENTLICGDTDLVIPENLDIPSGMSVTFQRFTVPEGITLTIGEGAELKSYALNVDGLLINRGTVFQGSLSENNEEQDTMIEACVAGHITNEGEMTLTDVFGKRNIDGIRHNFTMIETAGFQKKLNLKVKGPETQSETETTLQSETVKQSEPSDDLRSRTMKVFDVLEVYLPRLIFIIMLFVFGYLMITAASESKKHKNASRRSSSSISKNPHRGTFIGINPPGQESTITPYSTDGEDYFQRERKNWVAQLDEMMKSGMIDKKEYDELKKQFGQDGP